MCVKKNPTNDFLNDQMLITSSDMSVSQFIFRTIELIGIGET